MCNFILNPLFGIRSSFKDSCGIINCNTFVSMKVGNNGSNPYQINETNALIERDENGFTWVYKGKEHGYDSWYGIPPEE